MENKVGIVDNNDYIEDTKGEKEKEYWENSGMESVGIKEKE